MKPLFRNDRLLLIAGPCVVEGREITLRIAEALRDICAKRPVDLLFNLPATEAMGDSPTGLAFFPSPFPGAFVQRVVCHGPTIRPSLLCCCTRLMSPCLLGY